jgi:hypothetical protein
VSTVTEDVLVRSRALQEIVNGSEVVLLHGTEVDVFARPLGEVSLGPGTVAVQHLEKILVHLGGKPVHNRGIG